MDPLMKGELRPDGPLAALDERTRSKLDQLRETGQTPTR